MKRPIGGFHQDEERHWVAALACGHTQHVRHDPPWQNRPWVVTEVGRQAHLGTELDCVSCDRAAAFEDAQIRGLCEEGVEEASRPEAPRGR